MTTLDASTLILRRAPFAVLALLLAACAAGEDTTNNGSGGSGNPQGGSNSNGGSSSGGSTSYGGVSTSGGVSTGNGGSSSGGASTSSGGSSSGGASTSSGGAATGSGGATTASGGAVSASGGASSCATYDGATKADSTIFTAGFGKATTGEWQGYAYTYFYPASGTGVPVVKPGSSTTTSCFTAKQLCSNGSVPASYESGMGIGWNIGQASGATTNTPVAITATGIKFTVKGVTAGMRVGLNPATGEEFCHTLTATEVTGIAAGVTIPLTDFKQYCYNDATATNPPKAYAGEPIKDIQVSVPGDKVSGPTTFDFCIIDIEPG